MSGTDEVAASIRVLRSDGDRDASWPPVGSDPRWIGPPARRSRRPGAAALALAVVGPMLVWVGGAAMTAASLEPTRSDGECVGFCTTPREGLIFLAVYAGVFVVPVATLISWVAAALAEPEHRAGVVTWVLVVYGLAMAVLVALVVGDMPASDRVGG